MEDRIQIEICVDSPESALAAQHGGADRVELCDNLFEGGTTPSLGSIKTARRLIDIKLHVIIRPRGGDFLYSEIEFETMKLDIETAKSLGADGVVIGLLTADGEIDEARTAELVSLAKPMSVTFHRAFDVCRDPRTALETLIELGVSRVLTSGQQANAVDGALLIAELVRQAEGRIGILACGSIDEANAAQVVAVTGANEFHFTAFEDVSSKMEFRNESVAMGSDDAPSEYTRRVATAESVRTHYQRSKRYRMIEDFYCEEVLSGKTPVEKVAETANVLAYHHTRPFWETHIVVIPKTHVSSLLTIDDNALLIELLDVVKQVAAMVVEEKRAARVLTNLGEYQDSKHLHFHVNSGKRIKQD